MPFASVSIARASSSGLLLLGIDNTIVMTKGSKTSKNPFKTDALPAGYNSKKPSNKALEAKSQVLENTAQEPNRKRKRCSENVIIHKQKRTIDLTGDDSDTAAQKKNLNTSKSHLQAKKEAKKGPWASLAVPLPDSGKVSRTMQASDHKEPHPGWPSKQAWCESARESDDCELGGVVEQYYMLPPACLMDPTSTFSTGFDLGECTQPFQTANAQ